MKPNCYNCKSGTWDAERRTNDCHHKNAAVAVACQCFNGQCPYFEKGEKKDANH